MMNTYTNGTCALQMPSSYVLMTEEEMTYVDGGKFYGVSWSATTCGRIAKAWNGWAIGCTVLGAVITIAGAFIPCGNVVTTAAGLTLAVGGLAFSLAASVLSAASYRGGIHIGYDSTARRFSWGYGA